MGRGQALWTDLELNKSDEYYEEQLPYFQLLENRDEEDKPDKQGWATIESEVRLIEQEIRSLWKVKVKSVFEIGVKLLELKKHMDRGEYKRTIKVNLPFSYSSAMNYRNVAEHFDSAEDAALFDSRTLYEIAKSKVTPELREVIINDAKQGGKWDVRKVKEAAGTMNLVEKHAAEDKGTTSCSEFNASPFQNTVQSVKNMVSVAVLLTKGMEWPEELTSEDHKVLDSILSEVKELAQFFRSAHKRSNR